MAEKQQFDPRVHLTTNNNSQQQHRRKQPPRPTTTTGDTHTHQSKTNPPPTPSPTTTTSTTSSISPPPATATNAAAAQRHTNSLLDEDYSSQGQTFFSTASPAPAAAVASAAAASTTTKAAAHAHESSFSRRDFEYAQRLQEEIEEAERQAEETDRELARLIQEEGGGGDDDGDRKPPAAAVPTTTHHPPPSSPPTKPPTAVAPTTIDEEDEALARRLEMEDRDHHYARRIQSDGTAEIPAATFDGGGDEEESDEAMARRMEMEWQQGGGGGGGATMAAVVDSNTELDRQRRLQEEEDMALAMRLMDNSLSRLGEGGGATPAAVPAPAPRPPAPPAGSDLIPPYPYPTPPEAAGSGANRMSNPLGNSLANGRSAGGTSGAPAAPAPAPDAKPKIKVKFKAFTQRLLAGNKAKQNKNKASTNDDQRAVTSPPPAPARGSPQSKHKNNRNKNNPSSTSTASNPKAPTNYTPLPRKTAPLCDICGLKANRYLAALGRKYHPECFRCMGCNEIIPATSSFVYHTNPDKPDEKYPLHRSCYGELFGLKCTICADAIPYDTDGTICYVKHPFFPSEVMCPKHRQEDIKRCTGCHRFEPNYGRPFADLGDADRCVCLNCCRTVVVDSEEALPLWKDVMEFFETELKLPIWEGMRDIPILVVGHEVLNDSARGTAHSGSTSMLTRGLCLSEHQSGRRYELQRMKFDPANRSFAPSDVERRGFTYFQVPDPEKTLAFNRTSSITAILCLTGFPRDLTASILCHEATHAWFKLHPQYNVHKPIPLAVEEGCCQLTAHLFLQKGLDPANNEPGEDGGPSDEKLRQYFMFNIETDTSQTYGSSFRTAAKCNTVIGIEPLFSHVMLYKEFPNV